MSITDTDLVLVSRGGTNYKATGAELQEYIGGSSDADTPFILSPSNGATGISGLSSATSSAFVGKTGLIHSSSSWQIVKVSDGSVVKDETSSIYLQSYSFASAAFLAPVSFLQTNTQYKIRVKYNYTGTSTGSSAWSTWSVFTTSSSWPGPGPYPVPSSYRKINELKGGFSNNGYPIIAFSPYEGCYYIDMGNTFGWEWQGILKSRDLINFETSLETRVIDGYNTGIQILPWAMASPFCKGSGSTARDYWYQMFNWRTDIDVIEYLKNSSTVPARAQGWTTEFRQSTNTVAESNGWAVNYARNEAIWAPGCYDLNLYAFPNPLAPTSVVLPGTYTSASNTYFGTSAVGYNPTLDITCYQNADYRPGGSSSLNYRSVVYRQGWANPNGTEIGQFSPAGRSYNPNCMAGQEGDIYAYNLTFTGSPADWVFQVQKFSGATAGNFLAITSGRSVSPIPGGFLKCSETAGGRPVFYGALRNFPTANWPAAPSGVIFSIAHYVNNEVIILASDGMYTPVF